MAAKKPARHPIAASVDALARAVPRSRLRRVARDRRTPAPVGFVYRDEATALAPDEVLIAVADASGVAVHRVRTGPPPGPAARRTSRLETLARRIAEIDIVASEVAEASVAEPPPVSEAEEGLLASAGLDVRPLGRDEAHLVHRASAEYARLLADSCTVEEAARLLGVNESRVRQRLAGPRRTLFGVKAARGWRIPKFQFDGPRLVPGIERVIARLPTDLHPVAVARWFTSPNTDLPVEDGRSLSPRDWLRTGRDPDTVAELAAQL